MLERNFVFFCLYLLKFFMELLVYPVTVFCLGMPEMQASDMSIPSLTHKVISKSSRFVIL